MEVLRAEVLGNSAASWLAALLLVAASRGVLGALLRLVTARASSAASRGANRIDDVLVTVISQTRAFFLWSVSLQAGTLVVQLSGRLDRVARALTVAALLAQIGVWLSAALRSVADRYVQGRDDDADSVAQRGARQTAASTSVFVARAGVWAALLLMLLDNLGVNISALIAGLGVGGVAVALAVQNVLGDLFGSITIALDKPFVVGDFIVVDELVGTVEHVGLKTTRLRSLHGEQLVFANADLLRARIKNYQQLRERRVVLSFGVAYETPVDALAALPALLREIIEARDGLRFDRAHFKAFAASSLDFEVVYFVASGDYGTYMDHQQAINLAVMRVLAARGVAFAYPTQTVYLQRASAA
ncbi:MAG: mechanosensitive ion channel family protein [Polyangiales bacterium]